MMEQLEAESKDGKCHRDEFGRDGFIIYRPDRKINPIFRKNERFCEIYAAVHPDKSQPQVWKQGILAQYGSNSASWGVICGVFEVIRKKSGGGMESSIQLAVYGDEFTSIHFINTYIDLRALKYFANDPLLAKGVSKLQNNFFCHSRGASIVGAPSVRESASRRKKPSGKAEAKDDDVTPLTVAAKPSKRLPKKKMVKKPEAKAKGKQKKKKNKKKIPKPTKPTKPRRTKLEISDSVSEVDLRSDSDETLAAEEKQEVTSYIHHYAHTHIPHTHTHIRTYTSTSSFL